MTDTLVFGFDFKHHSYSALLNKKKNESGNAYRITVMNGELESLLHGNNVFAMENGRFLADDTIADLEVRQLQEAVVNALNNHHQVAGFQAVGK